MSDAMVDRVTERWSELGLAGSGQPIWRPANRPKP
jgi:hypothetical protein